MLNGDPPTVIEPTSDQSGANGVSESLTAVRQPVAIPSPTAMPPASSPPPPVPAAEKQEGPSNLTDPSVSSQDPLPSSMPSSTIPQPVFITAEIPGGPPIERPLNVTDALTYLDSVKTKFQNNPDVYNKFLDIMKDFKSQLIDTPGVIERVSNLFHGHPTLIQGFNTFLPAGYRIECTTDTLNPNYITVTTPAGTTTQATNGTFNLNGPGGSVPLASQPPSAQSEVLRPPVADVNLEPALAYVQRVKSRYANEPDKYRRFLEILNPKTGTGIASHETRELEHWAVAFLSAGYAQGEVVQRVAKLFMDAPGLMKDFVEFLPDKHAQEVELARLAELQEIRKAGTPAGDGKTSRKKGDISTAGAGTSGLTAPQKRKRKPADREKEKEKDKEKEKETAPKAGPSKTKKARSSQVHTSEAPSPSVSQRHAAVPSSPRRSSHTHSHQHPQPPAHPPPIPVAAPPPPRPLSPADETQFFERVKRSLDNQETYGEFLKLVNLFTQDIIDTPRLVRESRTFLGDELMSQFMDILGWDERRDRIAVMEDIWTRPMVYLDRPSRNQLSIRYGSYRKLPLHEVNVVCSGRDEMCKSVLNDEYISQPTSSSEDSGFSTRTKNIYEEALLKSEEERHEYDFHIEAIHRTIQTLEPLNNKIAQLTPEERNTFKLKPNLNGAGKSVHLRVLKKVYGRDAGHEIFQAMQEIPALSIPVVLSRLKVKHEEWKRAQREWNKVWREVDAHNYHKSLDHQSITFRAADKKAITAKAFLHQIEVARDEQMAARATHVDPLFARTRPRHHLEYTFEDVSVLQDALKLTLSFLDRCQGHIPSADRKKVENFLRAFVPLFFVLDPVAFDSAFIPLHGTFDSDMDADSIVDDSIRAGRSGRRAGEATFSGDLRKKLLKSEQAKSSRRTRAHDAASPSASRLASPAISDAMQVDSNEARPSSQGVSDSSSSSDAKRQTRRRYTFFTNATFYVVFRLLELLYSRLHHFKELAATIASDPSISHKPNPVAVDLGILNDISQLGTKQTNAIHFYSLMLESCEKLFDNEIEQHIFEDQLRWMFGPKDAYKMFTVDRVIGALIKQVQNILLDAKSQKMFEFLRQEREISSTTTQDLIDARSDTEKLVDPADENIFRMDWLPGRKVVAIQLLRKDDSSIIDPDMLTGRWQGYVDSYVSDEHTEGVILNPSRRPFLRRTMDLCPTVDEKLDIVAHGGLEIKVCVRTYRLFFVSHTEDFLCNISRNQQDLTLKRLHVKDAKRRKWLDDLVAKFHTNSDPGKTLVSEKPSGEEGMTDDDIRTRSRNPVPPIGPEANRHAGS